ncbi:MAG: YfhO family protein, partial [Solirubrobacterales bacterium]
RVLFLWIAAVSLLAGHGFDSLLPEPTGDPAPGDGTVEPRTRRGPVLPVAALLVAAASWWLLPALADGARRADLLAWLRDAGARVAMLRRPLGVPLAVFATEIPTCAALAVATARRRLRPATAAALWALAIAIPNASFGWRFNPVQPRPGFGATLTERLVAARAPGSRLARVLERGPVFPANVPDLLGVDDANGASAAGLDRYVALVGAFDPRAVSKMKYFPALRDPVAVGGALPDLLSLGIAISDRPLPPPWQPSGEEDGLTISRLPAPAPRFHVVEDVVRVDDDGEALRRLAAPGFDARRSAIVAGSDPPRAIEAAAGAGDGAVDVEHESPHRVDLRVNAPRGGLLVASEVDYPGWEASVDGAATPVLRTDVAFRGVAVPPGEHRVSFAFVPRSFRAGVVASLAAAALLAWLIRRRA